MKKIFLSGAMLLLAFFLFAQKADDVFKVSEAERIINFLASDEMRGRRVYSPEIDKAADFIDHTKINNVFAVSPEKGLLIESFFECVERFQYKRLIGAKEHFRVVTHTFKKTYLAQLYEPATLAVFYKDLVVLS